MTARTRTHTTPAVNEDEVAAALAKIDAGKTTPVDEKAAAETIVQDAPADTADASGEAADETTEENTDPFAVLEEATPAEYTRGPARVDYEAITSPRVKADLAASFAKYEYKKDPDGNNMENVAGKSFWMTQKFPTPAMAKAYQAQGKKYAAFKEWTFRSNFLDDKTLRFCAKPKETRAPGSAGA